MVDFVIKRHMREAGHTNETPTQWAARSRREQGLSECVEEPATVADLVLAVIEASEEEARWP